ncbi:MAG TPA: retropepsin-like aspartic protease, partial [Bacteroidales bacterium]|nr:retropepsin-like aspartic protease [Bacteroidales bacterium]
MGQHVLLKNLRRRAHLWQEPQAQEVLIEKSQHEAIEGSKPSAPEPKDDKGEEKCYPVIHCAGMSTGYQPSTNTLKINGCSVTTLIDTGSCCTFVNQKNFPEDMNFLNLRPYKGPKILSASGHEVETPTVADVYFIIGNLILKHEVILTTELPHDCVIGMDWLQRLEKFSMVFQDPIMCKIKYQGVTELFWLDCASEREGRIFLDNDYEIAPRTMSMLTAKVEDSFRFKQNVCLIEGLQNPPVGLEIVTQCVKRPKYIMGMNTSERPLKLRKGTPIGVMYAITEKEQTVSINLMRPGESVDVELF